MNLSEATYVPALRWRMAEYQALWRLSAKVKERIVPLITIPPIEYDFDLQRPNKSVHEHVHPFVGRYKVKWGARPSWIAFDPEISDGQMDNGSHVVDFVFDGIRIDGGHAVPALPLAATSDTMNAVARATSQDCRGAAVLLRLEDLMTGNPRRAIVNFAASLDIDLDELDVVIDLRAPNFEPYEAFATAFISALKKLGNLHEVRTFVLLGTAIPDSFADIAKGSDEIPRHDWLFFKTLKAAMPAGMRRPLYGDHTTVHPKFVARDMRLVNPAGKLTYTGPAAYGTRKGKAFRGNEEQMHDHCDAITKESRFAFRGSGFSLGDKHIADCAAKSVNHSNLTTWKWVAINHHITTVADDLATLFATP